MRRLGVLSLAVRLLAPSAAFAQGDGGNAPQQTQSSPALNAPGQDAQGERAKPMPVPRGTTGAGRNLRLILKDGSYQMARDYRIVGDRVRYLSQERDDWEELPVDLVDWDATRKWESEHTGPVEDTSPAMKEAEELDEEESQERNDQSARMPAVAKGLDLPDEDGVFVLDIYRGMPELVELTASDLERNARSRKGIGALNSPAVQRAGLELEGAHAKAHLHVSNPAIYLSLDAGDETEPALADPITVNTGGANAVNGNHGAHSAQSSFVIARLDERRAVRIVGAIKVNPDGTVTPDENIIPTKVEELPGKRWLRVTPRQKLTDGEYALLEIISPSDINESVWDFRVDPRSDDNPGSIGPILKQPRE